MCRCLTFLLASPTLTEGKDFSSPEVRQSTGVKENILELCRCSEQRSDGWWETNYDRVIWTNRIWASALRSTPLRTERWSVQRPEDTSPGRQTPASNNTITQMLLILRPSVILHFHHISCSASPSRVLSFSLSHSSFLSFSSCVASHASGCWIIDGMLSWWDFFCCRLVCWSGFVLLSLSVVTLGLCVNVCVHGCKYAFVFG